MGFRSLCQLAFSAAATRAACAAQPLGSDEIVRMLVRYLEP
jgi:hypothetical protein